MLILTRKVGEAIAIGDDIQVYVVEVKGTQVKLGIRAPKDVEVHRGEIYNRIQDENIRAAQVLPDALDSIEKLVPSKNKK